MDTENSTREKRDQGKEVEIKADDADYHRVKPNADLRQTLVTAQDATLM